jgi:hypothetical protein
MQAFGAFEGESLRDDVFVLDVYFEFVGVFLEDGSEIGFDWIDLNLNLFTSISRWSLSLRSACTIIVLRSSSRLISLPLSSVFMSRVCGPSLRISTMLLAEEVSLLLMELILTFLSRGASVTRYFWFISLMGWVRSSTRTSGFSLRY